MNKHSLYKQCVSCGEMMDNDHHCTPRFEAARAKVASTDRGVKPVDFGKTYSDKLTDGFVFHKLSVSD